VSFAHAISWDVVCTGILFFIIPTQEVFLGEVKISKSKGVSACKKAVKRAALVGAVGRKPHGLNLLTLSFDFIF